MEATTVQKDTFEMKIWNFLQGERLSSEQITNGLRHTIPDVTKGKVIATLKKMKENKQVDYNSHTCHWRVLY